MGAKEGLAVEEGNAGAMMIGKIGEIIYVVLMVTAICVPVLIFCG